MPQGSFASAINPTDSRVRQALFVLGVTALTALGARCQVDIQPVPFTLQTFAVYTGSLLLGRKLAPLSQGLYLACGAAGLGVFAGAAAGPSYFTGATGGYLLSYIPAGLLLGWLADRGWSESFDKALAAMCLGAAVVFTLGVVWLSYFIGWHKALWSGCLLFLPSEAFKIVIGSLLVTGLRRQAK